MADIAKSKKVYSLQEIKKMAPRYRGKPENFDPAKVGKKPALKQKTIGPKRPELPTPFKQGEIAQPNVKNTEPVISDAIFGVRITVFDIAPKQSFSSNFSRLPEIASEIYDSYRPDVRQIERELVKEEVSYYATGLLWLRLLEVKAKQKDRALTSAEENIREATMDEVFNVPQLLHIYLNEVGNYTDKMGKETNLEIPNLPVTRVQNFGGYHAAEVNADTHNMFEEIPSLGVAGDVVMALVSDRQNLMPDFRVRFPAHTRASRNFVGNLGLIAEHRPKIRQRLASVGITATNFDEYVENTRFNLRYFKQISDILGWYETFKIEKVCFRNQTKMGGETQVIKTRPLEFNESERWTDRSVQPESTARTAEELMGAAVIFGFQLYKEAGQHGHHNWCCVEATANAHWEIPQEWIDNCNDHRNFPEGIGTSHFKATSLRQDEQTRRVIHHLNSGSSDPS